MYSRHADDQEHEGCVMPRKAAPISLTDEELNKLKRIVSAHTSEQRMVRRAQMILLCAEGKPVKDIATELGERPNTIILWRERFRENRINGLDDKKRQGRPPIYGDSFRDMVLSKLKEAPPNGLAKWDGSALSEVLHTSDDAVWRLLRKEGIHLSRQRTWCISTDPEFTSKAADIVGLYLSPPENAIVISVDEKPSIQALSRKTGYIKTENGQIVHGVKSTYRRNGTLNLFAALEIATGKIFGKTSKYKKRPDFQEFLDDLLNEQPDSKEIEYHIILDNYCTHKKNGEWLSKHPNVFFHYTPTSASWLNMVEIWFNILTRKVLRGSSNDSTEILAENIRKYIEAYNTNCEPFIWKKREVHGSQLKDNIANLCN